MSENSAQTLRRSRDDADAFVAFYRHHVEALLSYMVRRVWNAEIGLDLTAESFAQAFISRRRFRGTTEQEATAWLYRIAQRQLAAYFKRATVERKALARLGIEAPRLDDELYDRIEELADLEGLRGLLRSELARLSQANRDAVWLRVIEELPYSEIARRLGTSEGAARVRVTRGLKALADALNRDQSYEEVRA
jgi:RNA polymerase sigma factor (sigma-70 family)